MGTNHISKRNSIYCKLSEPGFAKHIALISVGLMLAVQIYLICSYSGAQQLSDYGTYIASAQSCFEHGSWYPMHGNLHDSYIFAPGLINYFVLQLKLFGSLQANAWLNLLLNLAILGIVFTISRKYFSASAAWWSVTFYSLLYSTWWSVISAGTEVPFLALSLAGIWIMLRRNPWLSVVAGVCFALANWIRPLVIVFIFVGIIAVWFNRRKSVKHFAASVLSLVIGYGATIYAIGTLSEATCGEFITKSSTGGINLIYTANDKAYGGVASSLCNDSTNTCFIYDEGKYTYAQKDSIWKSRAIEWIKDNPGRYAKLYLLKIPGMFVEDAWPDRSVLPGAGMVDAYVHGHISLGEFLPHAIALVAKSLVYYIVLLLFACSLWICRRVIFTVKGIWLLLWLGGVAGTCLLAVTPRYHYPFLFVMIMWGAYGLTRYCGDRCAEKACSTGISTQND